MKAKTDVGQVLESAMRVPTFTALWPQIHEFYMSLGFQDPMTDSQRIEEYKYISDQLGKFVGIHFEEFLSYESDLKKLADEIEDQMSRNSVTPNDRKKIVYCIMRDEWLHQLWQLVLVMLQDQPDEEEEDGQ